MKIAVTGATGQLGNIVINELKKRTDVKNIVALVRTPQKAAHLGVETRLFDYNQPEKLADALKGIDRLLLISSSEIGQRAPQHKNVIDAAVKANISKLFYTSLLHLDTTTLVLGDEHKITEQHLKESGLDYTLLRNGWYTENYTQSIPQALEHGALIGSAKNGKIASAPRQDYGEAAAIALTLETEQPKIYELAGNTAYTLEELAQEVSRQTQKTIIYKDLPENEFAVALQQAGLPEGFANVLASSDVSASKGDLFSESKDLSNLLGRNTTPLSTSIKNTLN